MKKRLALLVAVVMAVCVFAGCGGTKGNVFSSEEYGVYADGKMISTPEEMGGEPMFFRLPCNMSMPDRNWKPKEELRLEALCGIWHLHTKTASFLC